MTSGSRGASSSFPATAIFQLIMSMVVASLTFTSACRASQPAEVHGSILQEKGAVQLMLIDASTGQPLMNANIQAGEAVVCRKAPCPLATLWTHKSDPRGIVQLPHSVVTDHMLIATEKHANREIEVAFWNVDQRVWKMKLIPNPALICSQAGTPWTVIVAGDGQSAEVKKDGRPSRLGMLRCSQESIPGFFRTCIEEDVYDAGYRVLFSRKEDAVSVRLQTESVKGPIDQADLECVPVGK